MNESEIEMWEKSMNVVTARSEFDKLFNEYEKLDSYEEFLTFKSKYSEKLKFNLADAEDCTIYPYCTAYFVPALNNKGLVKIGRSLIKYTKSDHIVIKSGDIAVLDNLRVSSNNGDLFIYPKLKSTEETIIHNFPEDDPSGNNYKWHKMNGHSGRRLMNELRVDQYRFSRYYYQINLQEWIRGVKVYLRQIGQKNGSFGWKNYSTTYTFDDVKIKVNNQPTAVFNPFAPIVSEKVKPSANVLLADLEIIDLDYGTAPPLLPIPDISLEILTSFSGFGLENLYEIDYITHSSFPGTTTTGTPIYFY